MPDITNAQDVTTILAQDVARSGLVADDMGAYPATETELASVGLLQFTRGDETVSPAYVIPYYDMQGKRVPFYRVKVLTSRSNRSYLQPAGTTSHVYFPKGFSELFDGSIGKEGGRAPRTMMNGFKPALMICEGEKKAAKAVKEGFLCAALGGVYNWKSRTIMLPEGTKLEKDERTGGIKAKLPPKNDIVTEEALNWEGTGTLAVGMQEIIQVVIKYGLQIVIAFDTDPPGKQSVTDVQKAAATLGFELRSRGVPALDIRQLHLPLLGVKTGIDDFLVAKGPDSLTLILHEVLEKRMAFPNHPNIREHINSRLQNPRLSRSAVKELAITVITDLDSHGRRMYEKGSNTPYYFDVPTKVLMPVNLMHHNNMPMHETPFGVHIYRQYDVGQGDYKIIPWLAAIFTGEQPVDEVQPKSVMTLTDDGNLAYQISDGQYVKITGQGFEVRDNGDDNVLFKCGQVTTIKAEELEVHINKQRMLWESGQWKPWWREVLGEFKFLRPEDLDLVTLIFYASPWLLRWKGTQLPIEIAVGEPGSGKSSLYALRMMILTGRPALRNQPTDIRDWYAGISSSDGMYVIDNAHFVQKDLRQRLSDEMCRLVTEPNPTVEMRQLFTTAETLRLPVRTTFAVTAIQQPFMNADILQRSVVFELSAVGSNHDSNWVGRHLERFGGRAAWIAHHMWAIHMFFKTATEGWDSNYKSGHRLSNFEQIIHILGNTIKLENVETTKLLAVHHVDDQVSEYDWTMQGLKEFAIEILPAMQKDPRAKFSCLDIANWALASEEFSKNPLLSNSRRLGRYIHSHKFMVEKVCGIFEFGTYANKTVYRATPVERTFK